MAQAALVVVFLDKAYVLQIENNQEVKQEYAWLKSNPTRYMLVKTEEISDSQALSRQWFDGKPIVHEMTDLKTTNTIVNDIAKTLETLSEPKHTSWPELFGHLAPDNLPLYNVPPCADDGALLIPMLIKWINTPTSYPFVAILGEVGQGKTTAMQMLARELFQLRKVKGNEGLPLPFYIDLRNYKEEWGNESSNENVDGLLTHILTSSGKLTSRREEQERSITQLIELLHQGKVLVIFDGLDERTTGMSAQEAQRFIRQLWRIIPQEQLTAWRSYVQAKREHSVNSSRPEPKPPTVMGKMIITCRTHYFRSLNEAKSTFKDNLRGDTQQDDFQIYHLLPFNEQQIRQYLSLKLPSYNTDEILEMFSRIHNLSDLAKRPLLLNLISNQIHRIEKIALKEGQQILTTSIYSSIVDEWLIRDNPKHQISIDYKPRLMQELALALHERNLRRLSGEQLNQWLDRFWQNNQDIMDAHAQKPRENLKTDLRTATFIVHSDKDSGNYGFAHTSFMEYFLAHAMLRSMCRSSDFSVTYNPIELFFTKAAPSVETAHFLAELRIGLQDEEQKEFDQIIAQRLAQSNLSAYERAWWFRVWLRVTQLGVKISTHMLDLHDTDLSLLTIAGTVHQPLHINQLNLTHANLTHSHWQHVQLNGVTFEPSTIDGVIFENVSGLEHLSLTAHHKKIMTGSITWRHAHLPRPSILHGTAIHDVTDHCPRLSTGHQSSVNSAHFDRTGERVVSASADTTIKIWDAQTGQCLRTLQGHT
ncbi:MAG: NACHT and WD40 repeat domain-containing protein, partial [Formosimonas sp.]